MPGTSPGKTLKEGHQKHFRNPLRRTGQPCHLALAFIAASARELRERGTIGFVERQLSQGELNAIFTAARTR